MLSVQATKNAFDRDKNFEFLATFVHIDYSGYDNKNHQILLLNENGDVIYDFGYGTYLNWMGAGCLIDDKCYFLVYRQYYNENNKNCSQTDVYLIDGVDSSNMPKNDIMHSTPYPNPAQSIINLTFDSEYKGEMIHLYDSQGRLIQQLKAPTNSNQLQLNVSGYPKGIYYYEIDGISQAFIVN